jgi:hypothetical protein
MRASPPCIPSKSRMRQRARTDLCGGRRVIGVPTATLDALAPGRASLFRQRRYRGEILLTRVDVGQFGFHVRFVNK